MKDYRNQLLDFIRAYEEAETRGQMTLTRLGPLTNPDPAKTSYNDSVSWRVELTFGYGYFQGAVVKFVGRWNSPQGGNADPYRYSEAAREYPVEEAVSQFLAPEIPDWANPTRPAAGYPIP